MKPMSYRSLVCLFAGAMISGAPVSASAEQDAAAPTATTAPVRADFLDATWSSGLDRVVVAGLHGMVGTLEVGENGAKLTRVTEGPDEDFTAMGALSDKEVLLGSSTGRLYLFDGTTVTQIAELSEYNEPILDIDADESGVWVVGARGLLAFSTDGKEFEVLDIRYSEVTQPLVEFPGAIVADWYFGVSNVDVETLDFKATVGGEPAIADEHYVLYPDEGFVQFQVELDMDPPPSAQFKFKPGPPFRAGDVSWNVVLVNKGTVTIAGEFGMILQSTDGGETWIRRDSEVVPREPEPAYWLAGVQEGDEIWLTGAAGVSQMSNDGGASWQDNPQPGREGIFGITLYKGKPVISGAVGLIGIYENDDWRLADRTRLKLLSWLKTPVVMPDGSLLVTGGRATAIRYDGGDFERVPVSAN